MGKINSPVMIIIVVRFFMFRGMMTFILVVVLMMILGLRCPAECEQANCHKGRGARIGVMKNGFCFHVFI